MKVQLSQQVTNNPSKFLESLTQTEHRIFEIIADWSSNTRYRLGGFTLSQESIAKMIGVRTETVNKIFSKFRKLGIIETTRRFNNSCITKITAWWGTPRVQETLKLFFKKFPVFILNIAMLLSGMKSFRENKSGYIRNKTGTVIRNCINISGGKRRGEDSVLMKQKIDKILGIRAALLKRGETETVDPYKLLAFSEACLDDCSASMRFSTPKYPYRFFLAKAFEYCKQNNEEPNWVLADSTREKRLAEFEAKPDRPAVVNKPYVKKESPAEERKSNEQLIQETKERQKREQLASESRFPKVPVEKQYEEDVKSLETLREQIKEHKPGSFQHTIMSDLIRGFEERFARFGKEVVDNPPDLGYAPDLNNPFIRAVVQAQATRLGEVEWSSVDGVRIREFLNGVGVPI